MQTLEFYNLRSMRTSEPLGKGMTYTGDRPASSDEPSGLSILIVDDEPILLEMLLDIFHDEGFTVYTATNGDEALAILAHQRVTVVLTDFMMPNFSGLELAQRIRANSATASTPVLLMSAAKPVIVDDSITMVISKPFMIEDLVATVRKVSTWPS